MLVSALQVTGFRNLAPTLLEPSGSFNVFSGNNGAGKTNLLEAIYLVATLRSFRTNHSSDLVRFGDSETRVRARVSRSGLERLYEVAIQQGRKQVHLDGKIPRSVGDYFGDFNVVVFVPGDLQMPRGSPSLRRSFLDRSVFNRNAAFLGTAQQYVRSLRSRNHILRQAIPDRTLLSVYGEQLCYWGNKVILARENYLAELAPKLSESMEAITDGGVHVDVRYRKSAEDLAEALAAELPRDLARRQTTVGPHVDDLEFLLNGKAARTYASQGQLRALVLAWKTAEMNLLRDNLGSFPVFLLDDVSSELDPARTREFFSALAEMQCQCFVTTTHPKHVLASDNRKDFRIVEGVVSVE
ncbi:MAG: DNA replication/repair protein RecF [Deltaproteobacteria bacterium]|nr:DNA replication/repair protein RecF [Deltaproteobacteria bacterium]